VRYEVRHAKIGHTREETSKFDILVEADCHFFMKELALHLVEPFRKG